MKLAKEFAGKWVAIDPATQEVVCSGTSASEVLSGAHKAGVAQPIVLNVVADYGAYVTWTA
jgi:hypothetical protein